MPFETTHMLIGNMSQSLTFIRTYTLAHRQHRHTLLRVIYSSVSVDTAAGVMHPRKKCAPHTERFAIIVGPRIILNGNAWKGATQISCLETSTNDVCTIYVTTINGPDEDDDSGDTWVHSLTPRKRGAYAKCRMLVNGKQHTMAFSQCEIKRW